MAVLEFILVALMLASVNTERVRNYRMCPDSDCLIYDMFIDPCPEALYNKACGWSRNSNTTVAFIYNPEFGAYSPKTQLYSETFLVDWPFLNIDTNACLYTNCPVQKDTEQYWLFNLFVPEYYETTYHIVKFVLTDTISNQQCCFTFDINIV
ncbi:unnamed protein product [Macrosiphum euphorbiae]|uniref:MD-2-related lipid-recognition domain-containing protein n=1 Tax=Macrosiphum euphorbiae TaxID=13131 RepID=A0AAV0XX22_9HEMI|nr:unnamed protein product [Macrosiphum euphorbiae]